jgi:hexosaminidase
MRKKVLYLALLLLLFSRADLFAGGIRLVPHPAHMETMEGNYPLGGVVTYHAGNESRNELKHLLRLLENEMGLKHRKGSSRRAAIRLILNGDLKDDPEGYSLDVNEKGILIEAGTNAGLFYGIQTLRQLMSRRPDNTVILPFVSIRDAPRFKWRAMLLDEARVFQGMEVVKQLIDELSYLKINRLQWHLTDDQAWRIEIRKYPKLTGINTPLTLSDDIERSGDANARKGYYTQKEIGEIVRYAEERHITIVPEIEMPGHATAAIAAYPWLGVTKEKIEIPVKEKPVRVDRIYLDIFDVSDPRTVTFLQDVLHEVAELFRSDVVHIGGDEVNYAQWKNSAAVNDFMKEQGIGSPAELQRWLTNRMSHYLAGKNIRMMGWNDIMGHDLHNYAENSADDFRVRGELSASTIVHFWKGDPRLIAETVAKGHDVVNAYNIYTYMDYTYESLPLEKAYRFEPVPDDLPPDLTHKVIGLGCQMWGGSTCTTETVEKLHKQIFPRIAAYAEVGWTSPKYKDYTRFTKNLVNLEHGWRQRNISF